MLIYSSVCGLCKLNFHSESLLGLKVKIFVLRFSIYAGFLTVSRGTYKWNFTIYIYGMSSEYITTQKSE